jgi:hypothetical protein
MRTIDLFLLQKQFANFQLKETKDICRQISNNLLYIDGEKEHFAMGI